MGKSFFSGANFLGAANTAAISSLSLTGIGVNAQIDTIADTAFEQLTSLK